MPSPKQALQAIFDAERALRAHERALLDLEAGPLRSALGAAVEEATTIEDRSESVLRLERLADLCAQVEGPQMVDALITILDHDAPSVRVQAAEALVDVGFERYAELARGFERAIGDGSRSQALQELPWVLVEIAEPSARPLIAKLLSHRDVEIVASAVEALAELGSSGGAQVSVGAATYLAAAIDAPLGIVTFGGVMASDRGVGEVARLASLYGTDDRVYALGRAAFPGRWPLAVGSFWNVARRENRVTERVIGPMGHSGRGGYLDPDPRPAGEPFMDVTVREAAAAVQQVLAACQRPSAA
jgi:hypothetical protein